MENIRERKPQNEVRLIKDDFQILLEVGLGLSYHVLNHRH